MVTKIERALQKLECSINYNGRARPKKGEIGVEFGT